MYDFLHNFNPWVNDRGFVGLMARLGVSQFTAIAASLVCYPLDTIRKYQMVTGTSMRKAFRKIRKHAGIRGFYGGAMNNSVRTFLSALALIAYDQLKGRK
jgi:solute carrier family 25 (adenine nucleotide translocator) protein 4/5/6/31